MLRWLKCLFSKHELVLMFLIVAGFIAVMAASLHRCQADDKPILIGSSVLIAGCR